MIFFEDERNERENELKQTFVMCLLTLQLFLESWNYFFLWLEFVQREQSNKLGNLKYYLKAVVPFLKCWQ